MPRFEVAVDCGGGVTYTAVAAIKQSKWDAMDEWEQEEALTEACTDLIFEHVKTSWREL